MQPPFPFYLYLFVNGTRRPLVLIHIYITVKNSVTSIHIHTFFVYIWLCAQSYSLFYYYLDVRISCSTFVQVACTAPTHIHSLWNLDHIVTCGIPYANTYGIPRNSAKFRVNFIVKIPRNSAEFRGIPYVFQKIPYSAGSKKSTSVDTLPLCTIQSAAKRTSF